MQAKALAAAASGQEADKQEAEQAAAAAQALIKELETPKPFPPSTLHSAATVSTLWHT